VKNVYVTEEEANALNEQEEKHFPVDESHHHCILQQSGEF
jgi:hypothetical protein